MSKVIKIDNRPIGKGFRPYVIAELSANHNGSLSKALEAVKIAKTCGVDAIKIQTYTPDTMTINSKNEEFMIRGGLWDGYNLYDLYKEAQTPFEWHEEIFHYAKQIGITCFSTPFDESAVDLLEELGTPAYKIASFEAVDLPLVKYISSKKKPVIISTGMATFEEITEVVSTAREAGCSELILLHCISSYPASIDQANLLTIIDLQEKFGLQVGLSDHTMDNTALTVAVSFGATVIEKHFTLDKNDKGPDSDFSIDPEGFTNLCKKVNDTWLSLGSADYKRSEAERANIKFRRSLYFVEELKKGDEINLKNIRRIRPGYGLHPKYQDSLLGKKVIKDVKSGTPVSWELIDE